MFSIIKKELKQYFDHPTAYILLVVFLVINNFFYFRGILVQNIADMRPMFEFLPWLLLFFIPAITMKMLAEEKRSGTLELELVQPVAPWKILTGKLISSVLFVEIGLVITMFVPIMLSTAGSFDFGQVIAQYIGAGFLALGLASIGIFSSSITRSQATSFILSLGVGFFFIMSGTEIVTVEFTGMTRTILAQLSLLSHYRNMIRGVVDVRDVLYFVTISLSFVSISYVLLVRPLVNVTRREFRQLKAGVAGIVVISLLLNALGSGIPGRLDLTRGNIYTLDSETVNVLENLNDIVTIKVFESDNLPPQITLAQRDVRDMVRDFERVSNGNVRVEYIIAGDAEDADLLREAQSLGIAPVQFNVVSQQELSVKQGFFGLSVLYAGEYESIPFIDNTASLEYQLISFIKKLTSDEKQVVGFLVGHGEKSQASDLRTFALSLQERYETRDVSLVDDDISSVDVLVIPGPQEKIPESEQDVLREFIDNGGSVLFLIDEILIDPQTLRASPNLSGVSDFVSEYGVRIRPDVVFDIRSNESVTFGGGFVSYVLPYPFWPRIPTVKNNPISGDVPHVVMPWASSLERSGEFGEAFDLLVTTQFAGSQEGQFNLAPDQRISVSEDNFGSRIMAIAVNLYDEGNKETDNTDNGRLIVVGDSDFLTEQFARGAGAGNNLIFGINMVDWLAQDEALINIRSKNRQPSPLVFDSESSMSRIRIFNVVGIPLLVALFGVAHLYRRKKKSMRTEP